MKTLRVLGATALLLVGAVPEGLDSCAISGPSPVFSTSQGPADLNQFLAGRIGVLPRVRQRHLIGAFRMLSGLPLSAEETQSL
jgi:hypothetical protein